MKRSSVEARYKKIRESAKKSHRDFIESRYKHHYERSIAEAKFTLNDKINREMNHLSVTVFLASMFSDDKVIDTTGYSFACLEPLEYLGNGQDGGKTFDLAILSKKHKRLILVEVKTSESREKGRDLLSKDFKEKVEFVKTNFQLLLRDLGAEGIISWENVEFVYCIERGGGSEGLCEALQNCAHAQGKKNMAIPVNLAKKTIVWPFWHDKDKDLVVALDSKSKHDNDALSDLLYKSVSRTDINARLPIPFMLTNHPWLILYHALCSKVNSNFSDPKVENKKLIKMKDLEDYIFEVASAGAMVPREFLLEQVKKVTEEIVKHGQEYDLLALENGDIFIQCRGDKKDAIVKNMKIKYEGDKDSEGTYARLKGREIAMDLALQDYQDKYPCNLDGFVKFVKSKPSTKKIQPKKRVRHTQTKPF